MKIKEMLEDSRPRERLVKNGAENLSDAELLAIILKTGTSRENVIEMSNRLIIKHGLDKLSECSLKELQEINGIGFAKACQILALFELNKRRSLVSRPVKKITCAKDVFDLFHERLKDEKQEKFIILMLNTKSHIIGQELIAKGTLDSAEIHPREVFKSAIKNSAARIILVHNHPSGDPTPSNEDKDVTKKLVEAGEVLDIKVLDHVIVGKGIYWSWKEARNS